MFLPTTCEPVYCKAYHHLSLSTKSSMEGKEEARKYVFAAYECKIQTRKTPVVPIFKATEREEITWFGGSRSRFVLRRKPFEALRGLKLFVSTKNITTVVTGMPEGVLNFANWPRCTHGTYTAWISEYSQRYWNFSGIIATGAAESIGVLFAMEFRTHLNIKI
ncbi:hypothetical protein AVEN_132885-1 [Araneus ventricosus]|uniref:Uncharacterized protein n=1 Tax=Araneus ventricosus TaxID=182803 RepID=A0A4Y2KEN1_ARAVE|nr:hypothetical protein AVEN_132885-1 [Araneus ventricosus]